MFYWEALKFTTQDEQSIISVKWHCLYPVHQFYLTKPRHQSSSKTNHQIFPRCQTPFLSGRVQSSGWCCIPSPRWSAKSTSGDWGNFQGSLGLRSPLLNQNAPHGPDIGLEEEKKKRARQHYRKCMDSRGEQQWNKVRREMKTHWRHKTKDAVGRQEMGSRIQEKKGDEVRKGPSSPSSHINALTAEITLKR